MERREEIECAKVYETRCLLALFLLGWNEGGEIFVEKLIIYVIRLCISGTFL